MCLLRLVHNCSLSVLGLKVLPGWVIYRKALNQNLEVAK